MDRKSRGLLVIARFTLLSGEFGDHFLQQLRLVGQDHDLVRECVAVSSAQPDRRAGGGVRGGYVKGVIAVTTFKNMHLRLCSLLSNKQGGESDREGNQRGGKSLHGTARRG